MEVGAYNLVEVVGRGGMAHVWRATTVDDDSVVALKIITATGSSNPRYRRYFDNEIGAVARLAHRGIVQVLDVGVLSVGEAEDLGHRPGSPYLAMEFVDGTTLADKRLVLSWNELYDIVLDLLDALAHAHAREVVHLDIKPANVLLRAQDGRLRPILTDFGIARIQDTLDSTDSDRVLGTPSFMAPEQILGHWRDYGPWTDLYAVGSLIWKLLTGHPPFEHETTFQVLKAKTNAPLPPLRPRVEVPDGIESWLVRMLAREPRDRFASAADAAWKLRRLGQGARVGSPPIPVDFRTGLAPPAPARGGVLVGLRVPPFVGRDIERNALWETLREVSRHGVRVTVLEGPLGAGKTRLADWLCRRAAELGVADTFIVTHGAVRTPLDGLSGVLARRFRTTSLSRADTVARIRDALAAGVTKADEGVLVDAVSLGDIALPPGPNEVGRIMTTAETSRIVGRYLARVARDRPVIVVLDDIQWGLDSVALVQTLLEVHPDAPIFVVATHRLSGEPDEASQEANASALDALASGGARTIPVGLLDLASLRELVRRLLPASPQLVERLAVDARGIPAFVIETVVDLMERGELLRSSEGWRLRDDTQPSQQTLGGLWSRRVAFVVGTDADSGWATLEAAATLGLKFDGPQWRHVCRELGFRISADLVERLLRYRIVRLDVPEDREVDAYAFVHESLRQSILEHAERRGRAAEVEAACGRMLREVYPETGDPGVLRRIGNHFVRGGCTEEALPLFAAAALRHHHRDELASARELLAYHEALSARLEAPDAEQTLRRELYALWVEERAGAALAYADVEDVLHRARALGVIDLVADAARLKAKLMRSRDIDEANVELHEVVAQLSSEAAPLTLGRVLVSIGWTCGLQGQWDEAFTNIERATALFEAHGDHHWASVCHRAIAYYLAQRGLYEQATVALREAMDCARAGGDRNELAGAYQHLGEVHRYQGHHETALDLYRRAESLFEGSDMNVAACRISRALTELSRDRDAEAGAVLDAVADDLRRFASTSTLGAFVRLARATVHARGGDWSLWLDADDVAYDARQTHWRERDLAWLFELLGDAAREQSHDERARFCYAFAESVWRGIGREQDAVQAARKQSPR